MKKRFFVGIIVLLLIVVALIGFTGCVISPAEILSMMQQKAEKIM